MYITRIEDKEKLLKIIDALDELGKDYKVTKLLRMFLYHQSLIQKNLDC